MASGKLREAPATILRQWVLLESLEVVQVTPARMRRALRLGITVPLPDRLLGRRHRGVCRIRAMPCALAGGSLPRPALRDGPRRTPVRRPGPANVGTERAPRFSTAKTKPSEGAVSTRVEEDSPEMLPQSSQTGFCGPRAAENAWPASARPTRGVVSQALAGDPPARARAAPQAREAGRPGESRIARRPPGQRPCAGLELRSSARRCGRRGGSARGGRPWSPS